MLFNYFEFSYEGIIGGEAEMRGSAVKYGGKTVIGRGMRMSSKVSDKNERENQTKTRSEQSGRHNENGMECGKCKNKKKVLW